ncbi:fas apoptotic inhibitory molecule 1 isoform X2 [Monodelphis domestica]|uniref:fas apoptotic inhibitory molecule 1 isoform X2 n=1 Tax=Monodelphis domestica TaxID=13616 RepID=UPI0024E19DBA|nr:fas apoptotic inhibitory molecule 1 isoform X2 [Monodelphis domestica]
MDDLWLKHLDKFHFSGECTNMFGRSCSSQFEKMTDLVAVWDVALSDGVHKIEFEHGTTSGKRVVYVDGKEEVRREWMFKLVGKETFSVGAAKTKATINIDAVSGFAYEYTLEIDGKSLKKYMENRSKTTNTWILHLDGMDFRIVLEKDTMDVWCNGKKMETAWIMARCEEEMDHIFARTMPLLVEGSLVHRMPFICNKNSPQFFRLMECAKGSHPFRIYLLITLPSYYTFFGGTDCWKPQKATTIKLPTGKRIWLWNIKTCVQILPLMLTSCVSLDKSLNLHDL